MILWKLYLSQNPEIVLDAGLALLAALDQFAQNDALLQIANRTITIASALKRNDKCAFLLTQKAVYLSRKLSELLYRQQNLKLAAKAFQWIDFSLVEDKEEYAALGAESSRLENEIAGLEAAALAELQTNQNHYLQGKVLLGMAEISFSRFMYDLGAPVNSGPWKSKILNIYFVRRWNLDKLIGYNREGRSRLRDSFRKAIKLFKRAMEAFTTGQYKSDAAHVAYALALKHALTFHFSKARKFDSSRTNGGLSRWMSTLWLHRIQERWGGRSRRIDSVDKTDGRLWSSRNHFHWR
ncbi:MAG TPA: hypothetical protein VFZ27_11010 [Terriglobia bacterium]|nr:hypothetical protein [Terriglobia bacterium]